MAIRANTAKIVLKFPSNFNMGPNGYWLVFGSEDGQGADIDYDNRLITRKVPAWPKGFPGQWGHGPWGHGGWGHGYYGAGWGADMWAAGPWGRGAFELTATSGKKRDGQWRAQAVAYDETDNPSTLADRVEAQVQLGGTPEPCGIPTGAWAAGTLTLTETVSPDDEG